MKQKYVVIINDQEVTHDLAIGDKVKHLKTGARGFIIGVYMGGGDIEVDWDKNTFPEGVRWIRTSNYPNELERM